MLDSWRELLSCRLGGDVESGGEKFERAGRAIPDQYML